MTEDTGQKERVGEDPKEEEGDSELGGRMTFIEHLVELRYRIIVSLLTVGLAFIVIYSTSIATISELFVAPLKDAIVGHGHFIYTAPPEKFMFELKIGMVAAVFVSLPMIFYQFWAFVAPGLYKHERVYVGPLIFFSTALFAAGAAFFYFLVFPLVAQFFTTFAAESDWIQFNPKFSEVFSFIIMLLLAFGVVFELPLVVFVLARLRIVSASFLNHNRKYAVLVIVILAAIFTPPDVVSQMFLAVPMWILYEISVVVAWVFGPKPQKAEAAGE